MHIISGKQLNGEPGSRVQIKGPGETRIDINASNVSEFGNAVLLETTPAPPPSSTQQGSDPVAANEANGRFLLNPIVQTMREQELGKMVLGVSVPVTIAFTIYFFYQKSPPFMVSLVVVLLSIGCAAILNGLLLRDYFPLTATFMEMMGIAIVLQAVNGMVGSFLPSGLRWIGGVTGILNVVPFFIALLIPPPDNN